MLSPFHSPRCFEPNTIVTNHSTAIRNPACISKYLEVESSNKAIMGLFKKTHSKRFALFPHANSPQSGIQESQSNCGSYLATGFFTDSLSRIMHKNGYFITNYNDLIGCYKLQVAMEAF